MHIQYILKAQRPAPWSNLMGSMMRNIIAVSLCLAACVPVSAQELTVKQGEKVLSSEGGRYVFGQVSDARRDQYMLDTKTGRLWRVVSAKYKNAKGEDIPGDGFPILETILYEDVRGTRTVEPPITK